MTDESSIEVTGLMLGAGLRAIRHHHADDPPASIVSDVYRAMRAEEARASPEPPPPDDAPRLEILHIRGRPYAAERDFAYMLGLPLEEVRAAIAAAADRLEHLDDAILYAGQYYLTEPQIYLILRDVRPDSAAALCAAVNVQFMRWQRWYGVHQRMREAASSIVAYENRSRQRRAPLELYEPPPRRPRPRR